jgi:hypothetical protein
MAVRHMVINRCPRGQRPRSRTMLVEVAVSSRNTSRAGSNMPCSRIQRRRARATSARSCSAALFFEADLVALKEAPLRAATAGDPLRASPRRFHQASGPLAEQSAQTKRPRALPVARCCPRSAWEQSSPSPADAASICCRLGVTSNQSAASRREAPDSTAPTTRSRNSKEHDFGMDSPSSVRINAPRFNDPRLPGNPDSTEPKSALTTIASHRSEIVRTGLF